nr:phage tail sheath subtilisin-like domain-containing protein [uncultured Neokomagataea sp.]
MSTNNSVQPVFQQIPGEWAVPGSYTEIQSVPAAGSLSSMPLRAVIIGQRSNGAAAPNVVYENVANPAPLFGAGMVMTQAITSFVTERPDVPVDAVGVAPTAGMVLPTAQITFNGTPSASGTAAIVVSGYRVAFAVSAGATVFQLAASLLSAVQASQLTTQVGVTAELINNGVAVQLTMMDWGAAGNQTGLTVSAAAGDQVPNLTVVASGFANGVGAPDITPALQALGNTWYTDIVLVLNDQANIQSAVLEARRRCSAMVAQDARVWVAVSGTQGEILQLQSQFSTAEELVLLSATSPSWSPWQLVAAAAAQGAASLNADPARQLRGLPLNTLAGLGPSPLNQFSRTQRQALLTNGCTTLTVARDGTVSFERVVTTRVTDPATQQASGIWDVMIPAVGARVRYEWNAYVEATYYNAKLADDGSTASNLSGVVTCRTLLGSWAAQCKLYENMGWIDDVGTMVATASFVRDQRDRSRVNSYLPIKPMGSLIVLANVLQMQV